MKKLVYAIIGCLFVSAALAQDLSKLRAFGSTGTRGAARVLYFDPERQAVAGAFSIDYGLPKWKPEYDNAAKFDELTKGKAWRFGEGLWTTLDTNIPLKLAGRAVAPGIYYLGLRRGTDDQWLLEFYLPAKIHEKKLDAFAIAQTKSEFAVPLSFARTDKVTEALAINLDYPKDNPMKVTLRIRWGKFELTAPVEPSLK